ncbi:MAG: flagellar hook capping FlgD N-terminal domain-containing protein [Armatimonadota bacterium]
MSDVAQAVTSTSDYYTTSANTALPTQELDRNAFLNLLVTKLQNQDPMKPMEDTEFIAQLAQFSSLEQMAQLNGTLSAMNAKSAGLNAAYLIGRSIIATDPESGEMLSGTVSALTFDGCEARLVVNGVALDPLWVTYVE